MLAIDFWTLGVWDSLAASFNVMSDFMEYTPAKNFFRLRQEKRSHWDARC
jgi:hypothetical protein